MTDKKGGPANAGSGPKASAATLEKRLLERKVRVANRALTVEKLWPRAWLPLSIAGLFVLLSVFEVWQYLPPRIHLFLLYAFGGGFVLSFLPLLFWRRPRREESFARIEKASAIGHRPLTAFNDKLSQEDASAETKALWDAHRARAASALQKLKAGFPHPRIDKHDPFALRAALILLLAVAGVWAYGDLGSRMKAAFIVPEIPAGGGFRIDAWISPPAYTRKEPFVLANGAVSSGQEAISVPQGSVLTVKINGPDASSYEVKLGRGKDQKPLKPAGQSTETYAEYTQKIEDSGTLSVSRSWGVHRSWALTAIPDTPPSISFVGPIEVSPRAVMLFKYKVDDDYGVANAEARIERPLPVAGENAGAATPLIGKPPVFPLSLPRAPVKSAEGKTYRDLTAHPWAGLPVIVTLAAKDEAGHEGLSAPRGIILPERKFTKPLAKAVVGQRRALVEDPGSTLRVASNLNALAITAEDDNIPSPIYLNLRSAYWRLRGPFSIETVESVVDQLWDVALRIEDGNLSQAERELRAAQDRLKDAIERGASPEEIQKLMSELRQALNRYMQALLEQKSKNASKAAPSKNAKMVTPQDLQKLLDKVESLAKSGSPEAAAQMLNELRDILKSLQTPGQSDAASEAENAERMKQIQKLTDLMRQQQQLLDQTFRAQEGGSSGEQEGQRSQRGQGRKQQGQQGQGGKFGPPDTAGLRQRQDALQRQLQDLLSQMGPGQGGNRAQQKLQDAEGAMGEAGDALEQNDLGEATDQQARALENMRQSTRAMAEQMMRSAGGGGNGQGNRDPLGRSGNNELNDGESVKVPQEIDVQRARSILEELRRRLGQPSRPPIELDYLERLVKPY